MAGPEAFGQAPDEIEGVTVAVVRLLVARRPFAERKWLSWGLSQWRHGRSWMQHEHAAARSLWRVEGGGPCVRTRCSAVGGRRPECSDRAPGGRHSPCTGSRAGWACWRRRATAAARTRPPRTLRAAPLSINSTDAVTARTRGQPGLSSQPLETDATCSGSSHRTSSA